MRLAKKKVYEKFFYPNNIDYIYIIIKTVKLYTMAYPYKNKQDRYPNGFLPKIQYWSQVLSEACEANDTEAAEYAKSKLDYFCDRHANLQG